MQFSNIITLFHATLVVAFTIPKGLAPGNYRAYIDARGVEVHERAETATSGSYSAIQLAGVTQWKRNIFQRIPDAHDPVREYWCDCGVSLNPGDTDAAVVTLKQQFGGGVRIGSHLAFYAISGSVVAYACNAYEHDVGATADHYGVDLAKITGKCGLYIAGTTTRPLLPESYPHVGYMNFSPGLTFCTKSTSYFAQSC